MMDKLQSLPPVSTMMRECGMTAKKQFGQNFLFDLNLTGRIARSVPDIKKACEIINGKAIVEASGNVNLSTVNEIASTGVDIISSSAIVAKAPTLDIGLDM